MKNPKFKIVAMVILAAVVVGSVVYYSFYKAEDDTPPSITFENPLYQGFLSKDLCRLPGYEYTAADVAAYAAKPYEAKDLNTLLDGVHLYHSSADMTVGKLVDELVVPKTDNEVIVAYYDYSKGDFNIFPEGMAKSNATLSKSFVIPANNGFVVMSCSETKVKDVKLEKNPGVALSDDVENVDNEWILLSGVKNEDLADTLAEYEPIIKYLWVQKEAGFSFEKVKPEDLDTYKYGDYYMFWIKTQDAEKADDKADDKDAAEDTDKDVAGDKDAAGDNACQADKSLDCTKSGVAWTAAKTYLEREESYREVNVFKGVAKETNQCEVTYKYKDASGAAQQGTSVLTYEQDSEDCLWSVKGIRVGDENADGTCTEEEIAAKIAALDAAVDVGLSTLESGLGEYLEELQSIIDRMQEIRDELKELGVDMSESGSIIVDGKPLNEDGLSTLSAPAQRLISEFEELISELRSEGMSPIVEAIRNYENTVKELVQELIDSCDNDLSDEDRLEIIGILADAETDEKAVLRFFFIHIAELSGQTINLENPEVVASLNEAIDTILTQAQSGDGAASAKDANGNSDGTTAGTTCIDTVEINCAEPAGAAWKAVQKLFKTTLFTSYSDISITGGRDAGMNRCTITYSYKDATGTSKNGTNIFTYAQDPAASCTWTVTGMEAVATFEGGGIQQIDTQTFTVNPGRATIKLNSN